MALGGLQAFAHEDRERVHLLAGGAARHPHAQGVIVRARLQQRRQRRLLERFKGFRIAEEVRHADQQLLEQKIKFVRVVLEIADIMRRLVDLVQIHPPFDAPQDRVRFVG